MKSDNDGFCILPWVHASVTNTGKVSPCCRITPPDTDSFGSLHKNTFEEIRDNSKFTHFRQMMLNNQVPLHCRECHVQENSNINSLRRVFNKKYAESVQAVQLSQTHTSLPLRYGEVRFSNICNLACRTCGLESSSRWHGDHLEIYGKSQKIFYSHPDKEVGLIRDIEPYLTTIDTLYFVGGEPLLHKAHYTLLDLLILKGRTDIELVYNSNLTTLSIGERSVFKSWKKFKNVTVYASIDATHERFNLIRHGEDWSIVEKNIKTLATMLPEVKIVFSPTISVLNLTHLPDLIDYSVSKKLVKNISYFYYNFLSDPIYYQIYLLCPSDRKAIIGRLEKIAKAHEPALVEELAAAITFIKDSLSKRHDSAVVDQFKSITKKLDFLRTEDTLATLPELANLLS